MSVIEKFKGLRRTLVNSAIQHAAVTASVTPDSAIVIAPHPDDEALGCGGLIALKRQLGAKVSIILLTDGEASHQNCCSTPRAKIASIRRELAVAAGAELGLLRSDFYMFGCADGAIPGKNAIEFESAASRLAGLMATISPVEIYVPHPNDTWPDHEAASMLVAYALTKLENSAEATLIHYPVWLWHNLRLRSLPDILGNRFEKIDISSVKVRKRAAILAYLSLRNPQCGKSVCGDLPADFLRNFSGNYEYLMRPTYQC